MSTQASSIPAAIRIEPPLCAAARLDPGGLRRPWPRTAVDQALHRLVASKACDGLRVASTTSPDITALRKAYLSKPARRDRRAGPEGQGSVVVDGSPLPTTRLTDAVPARIGVLTDGRLRHYPRNLTSIPSRAPSRLYWAGRPAMRFVQALHWLRDMLPSDDGSLHKRLVSILRDPIMDRPFRTICAAAVGNAGVDACDRAQPAPAG